MVDCDVIGEFSSFVGAISSLLCSWKLECAGYGRLDSVFADDADCCLTRCSGTAI